MTNRNWPTMESPIIPSAGGGENQTRGKKFKSWGSDREEEESASKVHFENKADWLGI